MVGVKGGILAGANPFDELAAFKREWIIVTEGAVDLQATFGGLDAFDPAGVHDELLICVGP